MRLSDNYGGSLKDQGVFQQSSGICKATVVPHPALSRQPKPYAVYIYIYTYIHTYIHEASTGEGFRVHGCDGYLTLLDVF